MHSNNKVAIHTIHLILLNLFFIAMCKSTIYFSNIILFIAKKITVKCRGDCFYFFPSELSETRHLSQTLRNAGYKGTERILSRNQVRIIVECIGEP